MPLLLWVRIPTLVAIWWTRLTRKSRQPLAAQRKSFIIFRLDALGDLVLTTPLFRELKRNFADAHLTVVAQQNYRSILITNPHIDEILSVKPGRSKWLPNGLLNLLAAIALYWHELRRRKFDVAISPRWDTDEHLATLLCLLTNTHLRVGYSESASPGKQRYNRGFDRAFDICLNPAPSQHEVLQNLKVVEALGGNTQDTALDIHLASEDKQYAQRRLADLDKHCLRIAVGIGAQSPGRRWPLERYAACLSELSKEYDVAAMITCSPSEHESAMRLSAMLHIRSIISDSSDIRETCALLARCVLYIGNDTGAAHLAAAMQCPTLVISRHPKSGDPEHPNSPTRFAPWCASGLVLQPERGRDQCTTRCLHNEPHCIEQISVAEVIAAAKAHLMQSKQASDKLEASLSL